MPTFTSTHCDTLRQETIEIISNVDPGPSLIEVLDKYAAFVDDKSGINNYESTIRQVTQECKSMANPKFWCPINAQIDPQAFVEKLNLKWMHKPNKQFCVVKEIFDDIDQSFENQGLKSSKIRGTEDQRLTNTKPFSIEQKRPEPYSPANSSFATAKSTHNPILDDERLKNIDPNIAERILNEVLEKKHDISWDDIAGLQDAKVSIREIVVYPMIKPELFTGLLTPAKGVLLFGPPGTGKTLIGKCIACDSKATFFAISASSLTSKWIGEGEKMVRALFAVARVMQPSVVFIDEIDSLLTQRTDGEHDSSRKMKTEFLVQLDGVSCDSEDRLLIIGATNRPEELDEAAKRRFTKRLYIPLPDEESRVQLVTRLLRDQRHSLVDGDITKIALMAKGYSGADMNNLCKEAAFGCIRRALKSVRSVECLDKETIPPITFSDFETATRKVKATVKEQDLKKYEQWNKDYGSFGEED